MALVLLTNASTSPWTVAGDFTATGHKVTLFGSGGNGGAGSTGTTGAGGGGGGGGACTVCTYSSGTMTPNTTTVAFLVNAGGSANATQWGSGTAGSGAYNEALPGGNASGTNGSAGGTASGSGVVVGSPTITYTTLNHVGGSGGNAGGSNTLGGGGGGGSGGPSANGGIGATPTSTGGGGGGGGGAANNGTNSGSATGGNGGNGSTGAGGTGNATGSGPAGTGSSGGAGGAGAQTTADGGAGGQGSDVSTDTNTKVFNTGTINGVAGCGGGGGGGGGKTTTGAQTTAIGGAGGPFGGGGGGVGCERTSGGTKTIGSGGGGAIVINFRSTAWNFDTPTPASFHPPRAGGGAARGPQKAGIAMRAQFASFAIPYQTMGFEHPTEAVPVAQFARTRQRSALAQRVTFGTFPVPFANGWEQVQSQPPHIMRERRGAYLRGDDGTQAVFVPPVTGAPPFTHDIQFQPPRVARRQAEPIFNGIDAPLINFFPDGWEANLPAPLRQPPAQNRAGVTMRGDEGIESPKPFWQPDGFEQISSQDRPWPSRRPAALFRGDDGIAAIFPIWQPNFAQVSSQEPRGWRAKSAAGTMRGDDGIEAPFIQFTALEWPWVPMHQHPRPERAGAIARGDDGIAFPLPPPSVAWFETTPALTRRALYKSPDTGDGGIQSPFVQFTALAWPSPDVDPRKKPEISGALMRGDDGIEGPFVQFTALSWPEPPMHKRPTWWRAGAGMRGDDGTELPQPPVFIPWGETTPPLLYHRLWKSPDTGDQGIESPLIPFTALSWPEPPMWRRLRPERAGAIARGDDGNQYPLALVLPVTAWPPPFDLKRLRVSLPVAIGEVFPVTAPPPSFGYDPPPTAFRWPPSAFRGGAIAAGDAGIEAPILVLPVMAWPEPPMWRNPSLRLASAAIARGDDGTYLPTVLVLPVMSWPEPPMYLQPPTWRAGAILRGDEGIENVLGVFQIATPQWWDDRQPQEQLRVPPTRRGSTLFGGDPGIQQTLFRFFNFGWPVQPWQPPHPRPEKGGIGFRTQFGTFPRFLPVGFEQVSTQPPHPRPERAGIAFRTQFTSPTAIWRNVGFEQVPVPQPPHRVYRAPEFGDQGIYQPFVITRLSWIDPFQRTEQFRVPPTRRMGALFGGAPGIDKPQPTFFPYGWEPNLPSPLRQPPLTPLRAAAIMRGDEGNQAAELRFQPYGWEVQPYQPPRRWHERRGLFLKGDEGITFPPIFKPYGWEVQPFQPPRLRFERRGAILKGDEGIVSPYQLFHPRGWEPILPPWFRRPKPHVPVFLLQSVEDYAPFIPNPVAKATSIITGWGGESQIGVMELITIISAFGAKSDLERK